MNWIDFKTIEINLGNWMFDACYEYICKAFWSLNISYNSSSFSQSIEVSAPSSSIIFYLSYLFVKDERRPYSLIFYVTGATFRLPLIHSFLILSIIVTPPIHLSITHLWCMQSFSFHPSFFRPSIQIHYYIKITNMFFFRVTIFPTHSYLSCFNL